MNHLLYKLIPPRPSFPGDMSDAEAQIMQRHFAYWAEAIGQRRAVAYGPVMDPAGGYGVAVVEVEDPEVARAMAEGDPAIRSGAGFRFEIYAMPDAIVRA